MPRSFSSLFLRVSLLVAPLALIAAGCAEQFTTARRSQEHGMTLYKERNYGDAAGAFRNAVRQDPRAFESHYYLAVCYDEMNLHQQAFAEYRTTLDVMATTLGGQGEDEFRLQVLETLANSIAHYDTREVELTSLEQRANKSMKAEDWFLIAKVYRIKGDADKAIDAYRRATGYEMDNFSIRKEYGLYLLDPLNQRQEAERQLRAAWKLTGNDQAVNAGLARLGVNDLQARPGTTTGAKFTATKGTAPANPQATGAPIRTVQVPRD